MRLMGNIKLQVQIEGGDRWEGEGKRTWQDREMIWWRVRRDWIKLKIDGRTFG